MTEAQMTNASPNETPSPADDEAKQKRKKMLKIFALLVLVIGILYALWTFFFGNKVETDNAYVGAETAEITSMVSGQVEKVLVSDTQQVKKGDVLAIIDNRDAKIAVAQAEAELTKAKRQYTQSSANSSSLSSQILVSADDINSAKAQVAQAEVGYQQAQQEFARRQQLSASGAISKEEFTKSQSALNNAKASVDVAKAFLAQAESKRKAAQSNLDANEALIKGTSQTSTPDVLVAQAKLDQALLDLERTEIKAPLDGVIARRSIQVGQRIAPGASLMKIVPLSELYVDANFKESQLQNVKVGQKATLTSDLYGKKVEYHGTVIGFSGGTGSAFALIPAQNATGNWIKVVQRLPVRIKLDPKELAEHPLRVGLSMTAEVDTSSAK
ncbi:MULTISPECIES: HlyD family efflux transporter periplasmic adaptor subunit [unclassified Acinetobacter]|uniref:HlyD family secretion protein n=1 Tax=unclassified Acinetobacter TaxID=196816 RepID=UPI0025760D6E|nr:MULTISPECIES: HlyD family efflux transporter periplasmic adaptor subunit [unclassified Acinetobacter]MDM1763371.1 HlyD family efflux transporter periplasmic adaptor subunit [Acinetobacter sp. 226-1]MDM1766850.1 HlyD family efflux transporter periplasmic adaptor subunit [Acinetobacter sp. 226-4]